MLDKRNDNRKVTVENSIGVGKVLILWNNENIGEFEGNISDFLATDWDIVPEPPKTMGFQEAVKHLKEHGGKAHRIGKEEWKMYFAPIGRLQYAKSTCHTSWTAEDIESTDWIVVED